MQSCKWSCFRRHLPIGGPLLPAWGKTDDVMHEGHDAVEPYAMVQVYVHMNSIVFM